MDSPEFTDWIAYYRIDPFGSERIDLHVARILSMLYNVYRAKGQQELPPAKFMLEFEKEKSPGEQVLSVFKQLDRQQSNG